MSSFETTFSDDEGEEQPFWEQEDKDPAAQQEQLFEQFRLMLLDQPLRDVRNYFETISLGQAVDDLGLNPYDAAHSQNAKLLAILSQGDIQLRRNFNVCRMLTILYGLEGLQMRIREDTVPDMLFLDGE